MNLVLIGFGYWGPNIAKNVVLSKDFNLYGICDVSQDRLSRARSIYGERTSYFTDYHDLLANDEIDAFALALKNDVGQKVAEDILKAGKHIFIEKPIAKSVKEAELLKGIALKNKLILHVDHIMIYNPLVRKIKELIDNGEIGDLLYYDSSRVNLGPSIKDDVNAMWDLAVHDLAVIDYLSNGAKSLKVNALGLSRYSAREALTYLTVQYEGFIAMLKSSWISPLKERQVVIGGSKQMVVFDELKMDKLLVYDKGISYREKYEEYGQFEVSIRNGNMYSPYIPEEDSLLNSINHFADCIKTRCESLSNADQAIRVLKILEQADNELHNV